MTTRAKVTLKLIRQYLIAFNFEVNIIKDGIDSVPNHVEVHKQMDYYHVRSSVLWTAPPQFLRWSLQLEAWQTPASCSRRHEVLEVFS